MGERNLKLVADNKPRKRHILLLFACLAVVLGDGYLFPYYGFFYSENTDFRK